MLSDRNSGSTSVNAFADRLADAGIWERAGARWSSAEKKTLICCRVVDETHDVKTFTLSAEEGLPFSFEPGQFVTISVEIGGQAVTRCYTISSPPTRPYTLS
ncbi:MAG: FAD-binding oxidoreductase, partial [Paraburkholderia sp.]